MCFNTYDRAPITLVSVTPGQQPPLQWRGGSFLGALPPLSRWNGGVSRCPLRGCGVGRGYSLGWLVLRVTSSPSALVCLTLLPLPDPFYLACLQWVLHVLPGSLDGLAVSWQSAGVGWSESSGPVGGGRVRCRLAWSLTACCMLPGAPGDLHVAGLSPSLPASGAGVPNWAPLWRAFQKFRLRPTRLAPSPTIFILGTRSHCLGQHSAASWGGKLAGSTRLPLDVASGGGSNWVAVASFLCGMTGGHFTGAQPTSGTLLAA